MRVKFEIIMNHIIYSLMLVYFQLLNWSLHSVLYLWSNFCQSKSEFCALYFSVMLLWTQRP